MATGLSHRLARELQPSPGADWSRLIGGLAVTLGALVLVLRKSGFTNPWSDGAQLAALAVPCVGLYLLALAGRSKLTPGERPAAWRTVYMIVAVAILPLVLEQLLDTLGHQDVGSGAASWISLATGAAAGFASVRISSPFLVFPAVLLASIGGLFFIDWAADPELETVRKLAFASGVGCAVFGMAIRPRYPAHSAYAVDAAGVLLVTAASFGSLSAALPSQITPFTDTAPLGTGNGWETLLLVSSLALIAYTAATRFPGPAYIGSVGLVLFAIAVGLPAIAAQAAFGEQPGFAGWPALLTLGGLAAMLLSLGVWKLFYEPPGAQEAPAEPEPPAGEGSAGDL